MRLELVDLFSCCLSFRCFIFILPLCESTRHLHSHCPYNEDESVPPASLSDFLSSLLSSVSLSLSLSPSLSLSFSQSLSPPLSLSLFLRSVIVNEGGIWSAAVVASQARPHSTILCDRFQLIESIGCWLRWNEQRKRPQRLSLLRPQRDDQMTPRGTQAPNLNYSPSLFNSILIASRLPLFPYIDPRISLPIFFIRIVSIFFTTC